MEAPKNLLPVAMYAAHFIPYSKKNSTGITPVLKRGLYLKKGVNFIFI
jgi:hypothetical protein